MDFPVVMYGSDCWTIKKNWCLQTVVSEKTLENPLDNKEIKAVNPKGNQPWIFIESWSLSSSTLATWFEELTHWKKKKNPGVGNIEGKRRRGWQKMSCLDSISDSMDVNLRKLQQIVKDREAWHAVILGVTRSWTQVSNSTATTTCIPEWHK